MPIAVVTGPTSGIGLGFAEEFARKGFDLVLVARDESRMAQLAARLHDQFGVSSEILPADLSVRVDVDRVAERLSDATRPVAALVNNAGFGLRGAFLATTVEDEQRLLDVHVVAVMRLSKAVLPGMVERGSGMLLNVSSVAGFLTAGSYSAAKAWITSFTEGLHAELEGTGVRVTAVCPGYVHTEFHQRAGIDMSRLNSWMWLDVAQVVDQAMHDLAVGKPISVAGPQYKATAVLLRHGPRVINRRMVRARRSNPKYGKRE